LPLPVRPEFGSPWIQDVTPKKVLDDVACTESMTTYSAYTIQKEPSENAQATWAKALVKKEVLEEAEVERQVKKLSKKSVFGKKLALSKCEEDQVVKLMDGLIHGEQDPNFEWALSQLDKRRKGLGYKSKKSAVIIVYAKRAPVRGIDTVLLYQTLGRAKMERFRLQYRLHSGPPQVQYQQQHPLSPPAMPYGHLPMSHQPLRYPLQSSVVPLPQLQNHPPQVQHQQQHVFAYPSMTDLDDGWGVEAGNRGQKRRIATDVSSGEEDESVLAADIDDEEEDFGLKIDFDKEDEEAKLSVDALMGRLTNVNDGMVGTKEVS
jgi:hypothetical protein